MEFTTRPTQTLTTTPAPAQASVHQPRCVHGLVLGHGRCSEDFYFGCNADVPR